MGRQLDQVQELEKDPETLVGELVRTLEGEVLAVVERPQSRVCIHIPHVYVPVSPGAQGDRVQLVSERFR